jgi:hypothetical protein
MSGRRSIKGRIRIEDMAKPIFLQIVPANLTPEQVGNLLFVLEQKLFDYHVLVLNDGISTGYKSQVLSEKGGRKIDIDALAETVKQALNDQCS